MKGYEIGLYSCRIYSGHNDERIREYVTETLER
jgi:hypothetical protein